MTSGPCDDSKKLIKQPSDEIKRKTLQFFMDTSVPRILEEKEKDNEKG
jgi:hypothetical protein